MDTYTNIMGKVEAVPYAEFRFGNIIVTCPTAEIFYAAVERGRVCACGDCVDCRALEYSIENNV